MVDGFGLRVDVALRDCDRTMASDSGKNKNISTRLLSKIGQSPVSQRVRHERAMHDRSIIIRFVFA
jgi:hypothetical protein